MKLKTIYRSVLKVVAAAVLLIIFCTNSSFGQTYNYVSVSTTLNVDVIVNNPCEGANNGSLTFRVNASPSGSATLILVSGPSDFFTPNQNIPVGGTFTYIPPPSQAGNWDFIIRDAVSALININTQPAGTPDPVPMVNLPDIVISTVTQTNNTSCTTPNGQVAVSVSGGSKAPILGAIPGSFTYTWTSNNSLPGLPLSGTFDGTGNLNLATLLAVPGLPAGTYTVLIEDNYSVCSETHNIIITDPSPIGFLVTTTTPSICDGQSIIIDMSGSEFPSPAPGVSYQLFKNGNPVGVAQGGTGAPLTFPVPNTELTLAGQPYTFEIVATNGSCTPLTMTGPTVTVNAIPTTSAITGDNTVCANELGVSYNVVNTAGSTYAWTITGGVQASGTNTNNITINWGAAGAGNVQVIETSGAGCPGTAVNLPIIINASPTTSAITGDNSVCANELGISYSVVNTAGSTYAWTISGGAQASGTNTNSITVNWGAAGAGNVQVIETNAAGCPLTVNLPVTINANPTTSAITGDNSVCANELGVNYSVVNTAGSTYAWTISGGVQASGTNTNSITVNWGSAGAGNVQVTETNSASCLGTPINLPITINTNPATSPITGDNSVCANELGINYSVTNTAGSSYTWTISGGIQASGGTTNNITVNWGSAGAGNVQVTETNAVGCPGTPVNFPVTINTNPTTSAITGDNNVCVNELGVGYSVTNTAGSTYIWTISGGTQAGGGTTNSITVNWGAAGAGNVQVIETNAASCPGTPINLPVTINTNPATSAITGDNSVCANELGAGYSVTNTVGSTYAWTISGGTQASGGTNNNITVNWGAAGAGSVQVIETNAASCPGTPINLPITINTNPITSAITGDNSVCANENGVSYSVVNTAGSTYAWTISGGTQASGGTNNSITVNWGAAGAGNVQVLETNSASCLGTSVNLPVTVNTNPTTSAITGDNNVCAGENGVSYSVTNTAGSTYAWTISGGTQISGTSTNSITVNWGIAGAGNVQVTEINSASCPGTPVNLPITINANPTTSAITGDNNVCAGENGVSYSVTNTAGSSYAWTISGGTQISGTSTNSITVNWGIAGGGNVQVTEINSASCPGTPVNLPVTINANPTTSIITGDNSVCVNEVGVSYSVTNTAGSIYAWIISGGTQASGGTSNSITVNWGAAGAGSVQVTETNAASCSGTPVNLPVSINALPTAIISYAGGPFCATGTVNVTQTGQGGGTYSSTAGLAINSATGQINLATSTAGTYTVTYSFTDGTCPNTTTANITINALPAATISYAGDPFCATATVNVTQTGQGGGTYSSTVGLAINSATGQINLTTSTAGTYTVTYSFTDGTCPNTATANVTINALPAATISYAGGPFCATGTVNVTQTGQGGGTYSSTAGLVINSGTGQINLATSTAGTYTVTYSFTDGICPNTTTTIVTINNLPTATISYTGSPFCPSGTVNVTQTGQGGGTYSSTVGLSINNSTGEINLGASTAGTYTVTYSFTDGTCPNTTTTNVTINALPTATINYAGGPFCATGTVNVTQTGQGGGTYSSTVGLAINSATGQINLATSTTGTYTITYSFTDGTCPNTTTTNVTINALPAATISYAGSPFCPTGTVNVTQTGQGGGTYSSTVGLVINSGTGQINLATSTSGTYTVTYTFTDGTCPNTTTTNITINALPTATISYAGSPFCPTGTVNVAQTGQGGGTYSSTAGLAINSGTGQINLATSIAGTYTVTYSFTDGICPNTTTANVTINTLPTATINYAGSPFCPTGTINVTQTGQGGGTYSSTAGLSINGGTGQINLGTSTAGTYTVTYSFTDGTCTNTTTANVMINALPSVTFTTGATTICIGNSSTYTTQAGQSNYTWNVIGGTITAGGTVTDNSVTIQWTATGSVTVNYTNGNNCTANTPTTRSVTVDSPPTTSLAGPDQAGVCGTVPLSGNSPVVGVGLWSFAPGGNTDGNGNIVTPSSPTSGFNGTPGVSYTLRWNISNGACPASFDDVTIAFSAVGVTPSSAGTDQSQCNNGSFTLAANSPASGTGQWAIVGAANGAIITSPALNNSTVTGLNAGTSVTLSWSISNGSCISSDQVTLSNNNLPSLSDAGPDQSVCGTSTALAAINPLVGTGAWMIVSGVGGTITSPAVNNSGFTGTAGETYVLRWTVSSGVCAPNTDEVTITFDEIPTIAFAGTDITNACGTVSLNANNPTVGTGLWSFAVGGNPDNLGVIVDPTDNQSDFNGSPGITYILTWTISNGSCTSSADNVQIQVSPTGPTAANAGPDQNVCGTNTNLVGNTPVVGSGQWSFAVGGNSDGFGTIADVNNQISGFSGTAGQTYNLIWTISGGSCSSTDQVTIQFNTAPSASNAGTDQNVCGTSATLNANLPVTGIGVWSFASGGNPDGLGIIADVNNRQSGFSGTGGVTYTLTWTISNGSCTPSTDNVQISLIDITLLTFNTNHCQNGGNLDLSALVSASPAGGTLTFTGTQVTGTILNPTTPTALNGVQTITVQYVRSSCSLTRQLFVNVLLPTNPSCTGSGGGGCSVPVISKTDACNGNDGQINITSVSGGVSPYVFSIDNGANWTITPQTTASFTGLGGGNYAVLVRDINGCQSSVNTIVIAYRISGTVAKTDVTTCTATDGVITFSNVQGGIGPYTYSVNGGTSFQSGTTIPSGVMITGLIPGIYNTVIRDNSISGCLSAVTPVTIGLPTGCSGGTGQCATVVIVPKPSPAQCTLSNGGIIFSIKPFVPAVNNTGVKITIQGTSPSNLTISRTNFNDSIFTALPIGVYNYTIEYGDVACTKTGQVTIDQSGTVGTPVASNIIGPSCSGTSTGSLRLDVAGETGNVLEWSLDGGITDPFKPFTVGNQITNIPAGPAPSFERVISVRRNNSDPCYASVRVVIQDVNAAINTSFNITPATCNGADGAITNIVAGGGSLSGYQFSIDGGLNFQSTNEFNSLAGGIYTLRVKDGSGCEKDFTANVTFPGFINAVITRTNADCSNNGVSGSISVNIMDPGVFQVALSTDQFNVPADGEFRTYSNPSVSFNQLARGQYFVYMKSNAAACPTRSAAIDIIGVYPLSFEIQPQCTGNDLSITLVNMVGEPNLPFEILVFRKFSNVVVETIPVSSMPATASFFIARNNHAFLRTPGEYQLQFVQINPLVICEIRSALVDFTVPLPLEVSVGEVKESYPDMATGSIQLVDFTGGRSPYEARIELDSASSTVLPAFETDFEEVFLNNNQRFEKIYEDVPPGRYVVQVSDSFGCTIQLIARVLMDKDIYIPNIFTPNDDGANDDFFIRNLPIETGKVKLMITSRWGKEIFSTDNYQNNWRGEGAVDGIYFYRLQINGTDPITGWVEVLRGQKP